MIIQSTGAWVPDVDGSEGQCTVDAPPPPPPPPPPAPDDPQAITDEPQDSSVNINISKFAVQQGNPAPGPTTDEPQNSSVNVNTNTKFASQPGDPAAVTAGSGSSGDSSQDVPTIPGLINSGGSSSGGGGQFGVSSKLAKSSVGVGGGALSGTYQQTIDFLMGKGLPRAGAAAILANLILESDAKSNGNELNPNALGDNGESHGIGQWRNGRAAGLPGTVGGQLDFLWDSLQQPQFSNLLANLKNPNSDPEALTRQWCTDYEQAEEPNMDGRLANLREVL